jgi:hypothetical protein
MGHATFKIGDLTAVIGDNSSDGPHRAGYNGVWSLEHRAGRRSVFVPAYAGLNHEHIFNGDPLDDTKVFFEPRVAPMTFRQISESEAELHQPPTPTFHLESWTRFKLTAPHYLDMSYRCIARQHVFQRGYIGLFWANYINGPADKSMYFLGGLDRSPALWSQLCTQRHIGESTVRFRDDTTELTYAATKREALFHSLSPLRFTEPFFYGNFDDLVWLVMFDRSEGIRLTHSPSGGGVHAENQTSNPAWDFQFIVPRYEVLKEYGFNLRTVLRPRCPREELVAEFRKWKSAK